MATEAVAVEAVVVGARRCAFFLGIPEVFNLVDVVDFVYLGTPTVVDGETVERIAVLLEETYHLEDVVDAVAIGRHDARELQELGAVEYGFEIVVDYGVAAPAVLESEEVVVNGSRVFPSAVRPRQFFYEAGVVDVGVIGVVNEEGHCHRGVAA